MKRLLENQLIFGNLLTIDEPHLVERYNVALKGFGLKAVKLKNFQIDMTGFSPEIAKALKDDEYLDPKGVNRRFIILTPEQANLPVVHTRFSNTEELMVGFFEANKREIFAITIKDVLYGEIEERVHEVTSIEDLLAIEQVEFKLSTGGGLLGKATQLQGMIERLMKEPDAWQDDQMLDDMVKLAKTTGDVRQNELLPRSTVFRHKAFWTSHFGGVYVFNDDGQITVIANKGAKGFRRSRPWEVSYLDFDDAALVHRFLAETGRLDPPRGAWIERSGLLENRARLLLIAMMREAGFSGDYSELSNRKMDNFVRDNAPAIRTDGRLGLLEAVHQAAGPWANIDISEVSGEDRFLISRANPAHEDWWLVNRLISEYLVFDFMTLFVFNKQGFYNTYPNWPENYRDFVVKSVRDTYFKDKAEYRARLFG